MHFGKSECAAVTYNSCSYNSCKKKKKDLEKMSIVTESNSLLKVKCFFFIECLVQDNLHYQLLIYLTLKVYLERDLQFGNIHCI